MASDWKRDYEIQYIDCHEEQRRLFIAVATVVTISCRIFTPLSRWSLVLLTDSLMPQRSPATLADSVHCCHGAHRCVLQTLCPVDTAVIVVSCSLLATITVSGFSRRTLTSLSQLSQVTYRLPRHSSVSTAEDLLPELSPVTPADSIHCRQITVSVAAGYVECFHPVVCVSCRLSAATAVSGTSCSCFVTAIALSTVSRRLFTLLPQHSSTDSVVTLPTCHSGRPCPPLSLEAATKVSSAGCLLRCHGRNLWSPTTLRLCCHPNAVKCTGCVQGLRECVCYGSRVMRQSSESVIVQNSVKRAYVGTRFHGEKYKI